MAHSISTSSAVHIEPPPFKGQLLGPLWAGPPPWLPPTTARAAAASTVVAGTSTLALRASTLARVDAPADFNVGDRLADRRRQAVADKVTVAAERLWLRAEDPPVPNPYDNGAPAWGRSGTTSPRWERPLVEIRDGEPVWTRIASK